MGDLLKPCPFCGGAGSVKLDPEGTKDSMGKKWAYTVSCNRCCASTGVCWSREMAIVAWNGRVKVPSLVDAEEIKHARWLTDRFGMERIICSICGVVYEGGDSFRFCPKCGAKMDLED